MSPLLPPVPVPVPVSPEGPEINRQYLVERNGEHTLRDGGPRAPSPGVVEVTQFYSVVAISRDTLEIDESDLPEGIDYALWSKAVKPASRDGFEDTLDFVDLLDD